MVAEGFPCLLSFFLSSGVPNMKIVENQYVVSARAVWTAVQSAMARTEKVQCVQGVAQGVVQGRDEMRV